MKHYTNVKTTLADSFSYFHYIRIAHSDSGYVKNQAYPNDRPSFSYFLTLTRLDEG